ncbi:sensor histidine kinase [Nitratireductor luteus]|uniref:sensor histidine kinase n=1 Tax=Nitratireductor luteus TaxID=2976980 RepID=UPI00223FA465|nr:ATP-binding protein [Nitratireductor luteus]
MPSGGALARRYRRYGFLNLIATLGVVCAAAYFTASYAGGAMEANLRASARETLAVQAEALSGMLDKHRLLAGTLSRRGDVRALFSEPGQQVDRQAVWRIGVQAAGLSSALDVVFFTTDGEPIASGLSLFDDSRLDPSSQLVRAAKFGQLGREAFTFAHGQRAYVFTSGIRGPDTAVVAIVAVFVSLDRLEATWSLSANPIYVVAENGNIFLSNRSKWRLRPEPEIMQADGDKLLYETSEGWRAHLDASRFLPLLDWELHVLSSTASADIARLLWGAIAGGLVLLASLGVQALINRQYVVTLRGRRDRAVSLRLERVVRDRTRALSQSNKTLKREVHERRQAEEQLRRTQSELVQTGKLAALGQMSVSLSHEFNQPLAATKSYADNALKYLERGRGEEARDNIRRISELTDRMADISRHLRNFARKPNPTFGNASITKVIEDAMAVLGARLREAGARVELDMAEGDVRVRGGPVRLQQVFVNLFSNALDAMEGVSDPIIEVSVRRQGDRTLVAVRDHGSGIAPEALASMFDPFFTTKEVGKGMGMGLSISYNIIKDFGGRLTAANHGEGAVFTVELESALEASEAAQ